ncbi:hypothetical protein N7510_000004 [Penicillium lagena]|uniref:uncharacterized protein n=1 Tax=Penicillium lagena TaxID=94218 RepID=UPI0025405368|nr:uncharacterized protein N7510_011839 [Penicillium lagena]XP_056837051.1 uncharacterized protein N7510_000004 [Penicillium lagena]KAJ5598889.1 hypothetical protein N7510_011839 [Penicillium lagena]KAJ5623695.1 hypothetical protein N7510_000004 [Penicillium lagena]
MFDIDEHEIRVLSGCHELGLTSELIEAFHAMRAYSAVVEKYMSGSLANPNLDRIADQRNFTQHRILSLPQGSQLAAVHHKQLSLYEPCRIAAMIYGVGVIFPLPEQTAPFKSLATMLKRELQQTDWSYFSQSSLSRRFLLWILVMGGMASLGMPERNWYVSQLHTCLSQFRTTTFSSLRRSLKSVLWLDCACDTGARELWKASKDLE